MSFTESAIIGITSYGVNIPRFRISTSEIANAHNKNPDVICNCLGLIEKAVADIDEDAVTLATSSAICALENGNINPEKIKAIYIGSESHPYAVKPTSSIVANALGLNNQCFACDLEFACKAGTAGIQIVASLLLAKKIEYGLAIGTDTAQGEPEDALEYSAASGASAIILGKDNVIASLDEFISYTTDTPDFWRAHGEKYPSHAGRFTGEPAYFKHVITATELILEKTQTKIKDYDHIIFHQPNAKFPTKVAKHFGVTQKQLEKGLIVRTLGNTYSAASMIGLCNILDYAKPGEKILLTSYGSGAGSDSFVFTVTKNIVNYKNIKPVKQLMEDKTYISYPEYIKMRGKI